MKRRIERPKLLIVSFVVMYSLSSIQFYQRQNDYIKLRNEGIITLTKTKFIPKNYNADHYRLEFETIDGKKISRTSKCGDERTFIEKYKNLKVIYLLEKPEKYWNLSDFETYSLGWSIFFFFGPYGIIGTWVCYGFMRFIDYFRSKKNRQEFIKNVAQQRV